MPCRQSLRFFPRQRLEGRLDDLNFICTPGLRLELAFRLRTQGRSASAFTWDSHLALTRIFIFAHIRTTAVGKTQRLYVETRSPEKLPEPGEQETPDHVIPGRNPDTARKPLSALKKPAAAKQPRPLRPQPKCP
jgi:hypothetical protein